MIKKIALLTGLILTNTAFANDAAALHNHLTIAAIDQQKGLFNARELHDMGSSGVQQIDYVVNCSNNTMAMADFAVLTPQGRMPANISSATVDMLSFYKPVIHHDLKIANSVCGKQLAMLKTNAMP